MSAGRTSATSRTSSASSVYVFDRATGEATLRSGDVGWGRNFPVVQGEALGLVLGEAEALWVRACWEVTRRRGTLPGS